MEKTRAPNCRWTIFCTGAPVFDSHHYGLLQVTLLTPRIFEVAASLFLIYFCAPAIRPKSKQNREKSGTLKNSPRRHLKERLMEDGTENTKKSVVPVKMLKWQQARKFRCSLIELTKVKVNWFCFCEATCYLLIAPFHLSSYWRCVQNPVSRRVIPQLSSSTHVSQLTGIVACFSYDIRSRCSSITTLPAV